LEDHSGRIQLAGDVLKNSFLVTGMIIAVVGKEVSGGSFEVEEVILPGVAEAQNPAPDLMEDSYVLFASGLNLGKHDEVSTETLLDFIEGNIGVSLPFTFAQCVGC
jgi:DNA polymerase delta subunit 2